MSTGDARGHVGLRKVPQNSQEVGVPEIFGIPEKSKIIRGRIQRSIGVRELEMVETSRESISELEKVGILKIVGILDSILKL